MVLQRIARAAWLPLVGALFAFTCASCQRGPSCHPVHGKVLAGEQPAEGALVVFVPSAGGDPKQPLMPSGRVEADGTFTLQTFDPRTRTTQPGAPVGSYVVTVSWPSVDPNEWTQHHPGEEMPDRWQGRYSSATKSDLRAEVKAGANDLAPFPLPAVEAEADK